MAVARSAKSLARLWLSLKRPINSPVWDMVLRCSLSAADLRPINLDADAAAPERGCARTSPGLLSKATHSGVAEGLPSLIATLGHVLRPIYFAYLPNLHVPPFASQPLPAPLFQLARRLPQLLCALPADLRLARPLVVVPASVLAVMA
jgi:hypothetical protein